MIVRPCTSRNPSTWNRLGLRTDKGQRLHLDEALELITCVWHDK
jgi:hypothetical protein